MKKVKYADAVPSFIRLGTGWGPHVDWEDIETNLDRWRGYGPKDGTEGLILDPVYQRDHVWTDVQQIAYLEYAMRGGISGREIYFNCSSWGGKYNTPIELVDGKQRLQAIRMFMRGELKVFGKYCVSDFERLNSNCCYVIFKMNNLKTQKEVMQWYVEFNSGGTVHTNEEIERVKKLIEKTKC